MDRREFLLGLGAALLLPPTGGCLAGRSGESARTGPSGGGERDKDDAGDKGDESSSMPEGRGPVRGENDAEIEIREVEDDEDVEYVEEDDAVRYVAAWRHVDREAEKTDVADEQNETREDGPPERDPVFETTPFERWGETQCLSAAGTAAAEHVNDELDTDDVGGGITATVEGEDRAAFVSVETVLDRGGEVVHEPDVEFEELVAATPATVDVTYVLGEREYELAAPVYAEYTVLRND